MKKEGLKILPILLAGLLYSLVKNEIKYKVLRIDVGLLLDLLLIYLWTRGITMLIEKRKYKKNQEHREDFS